MTADGDAAVEALLIIFHYLNSPTYRWERIQEVEGLAVVCTCVCADALPTPYLRLANGTFCVQDVHIFCLPLLTVGPS